MHTVFFWLKEPDNEEARAEFQEALETFIAKSPGINNKHIGTPADTDRPVIDSSYSFSLILSFDSKKEHDIYQEHPVHKEFIAKASPLWERVQVYDSVVV